MIVYKIVTHTDDEPRDIFKTKEELEEFCKEYNITDYEIEECPVYYKYIIKYRRINDYTYKFDKVTKIKTLATSIEMKYFWNNYFHISFDLDRELSEDEIYDKIVDVLKDTEYYIDENDKNTIIKKGNERNENFNS